jgi:hypothetical protein
MWPVAGGETLELPALRVPFEAVDAWWLAGGQPVDAKASTT